MPYAINWYIKGQVLFGNLSGEQTVNELMESNELMLNYLDTSDGRLIHAILNDEKLEKVPMNIIQLQKALTYPKHPNLGWAVMVGEKDKTIKDAAGDFLITLLAKITRARYTRVKTFNEAIEFLKRVDTTVNWDAVEPGVISQSATK